MEHFAQPYIIGKHHLVENNNVLHNLSSGLIHTLAYPSSEIMRNLSSCVIEKRTAFVLAASAAAVAIAANWGPFIVANATYESDNEVNFVAAGNIPRQVMMAEVQKIKRGDTVRVVYADGKVYDFEASRQCSYAASVSCGLVYPKLKTSATVSPPTRSYSQAGRLFERNEQVPRQQRAQRYIYCQHGLLAVRFCCLRRKSFRNDRSMGGHRPGFSNRSHRKSR